MSALQKACFLLGISASLLGVTTILHTIEIHRLHSRIKCLEHNSNWVYIGKNLCYDKSHDQAE